MLGKLTLVFFFACIFPSFVLASQILYGGLEPETLKSELRRSTIYTTVSSIILHPPAEAAKEAPSEIDSLIMNRFTAQYVQIKTEKLIDDTYLWLTKDGPSPVLSFSEVKDDLLASDPALQMQIDEFANASSPSDGEANGDQALNELATDPAAQEEMNSLVTLMRSDFSIPVGQYFAGLKTFYDVLKIIHPILGVILLALLIFLMKVNYVASDRLRWAGLACIAAAIVGYGIIAFNAIAVANLSFAAENNAENLIATFSPIILALMNIVFNHFAQLQYYIHGGMAGLGLLLILLSVLPTKATQTAKNKSLGKK